jgi:hypothetical protein
MKVATSMTILIAIATLLLWIPTPPVSNDSAANRQQQDVAKQQTKNEPTPCVSTKSATDTENSKTSKKDAASQPQGSLYVIYLMSGPLVVIVTVGTGILVWRQIRVMRRVERAQIDLDFDVSNETYQVLLSNHGRSIAIITAYNFVHASFSLTTIELDPEEALCKFEDGWRMHAMVPPNIKQQRWYQHDLKSTLGEEIRKSDRQIILSGTVEYVDIFGKRHETEVVYRYIRTPPEHLRPLWEYGKYS